MPQVFRNFAELVLAVSVAWSIGSPPVPTIWVGVTNAHTKGGMGSPSKARTQIEIYMQGCGVSWVEAYVDNHFVAAGYPDSAGNWSANAFMSSAYPDDGYWNTGPHKYSAEKYVVDIYVGRYSSYTKEISCPE